MSNPKMPTGFAAGGRALWSAITELHELDPAQAVQLTEACRAKDRLDQLDNLLRGDVSTWAQIYYDPLGAPIGLRIDSVLDKANTTANLLKQLLAALRLPDEASGKRPQVRSARGAQRPSVPGGRVSSLDRARAAKSS